MKFSLSGLYSIFAPTSDGFGEFIIIVSLVATIGLACVGKLTDGFAAALTAIGGFGVIHDNMTAWLAQKIAQRGGANGNGN